MTCPGSCCTGILYYRVYSSGACCLQNDFTSADFADMPAPLTYNMFKMKTEYPLHTAIRTQREDVVFLYLVEHDSQVLYKLF